MQFSIQTRLFFGFTVLSTILVLSSSYLYYWQSSKELMSEIEETHRQQLYRYQESLDNVIEQMDRVSAQVVYNSTIKNYLIETFHGQDSSFQSFTQRKKFEELLAMYNSPWFIASQINLMTMDGFFLTYGKNMEIPWDVKQRILQSPWLEQAVQLNGDKLLLPPHESEWQNDRPVYFSLVRSFNFPEVFPPATVELQQSYDLLIKTMETGRIESSKAKVYVMNDSGELFYPYIPSKSDQPKIPTWSGSSIEMKNEDGEGTDIWSQVRSEFSGLTILIQQPKSEAMLPITHLRRITLTLGLLGEGASVVIAYFLAANMTYPIRYLQKRLEKVTIDEVMPLNVKKLQNTKEIAMLHSTFVDMKVRLNQSLNEVLQSQKRENMAHLHAMYAQMNPHFLFNTLTAMASYAEESGFPEYAHISHHLSGMLRYSTNSMTDAVTLKQEIQYTVQYMELMKFRYEGQFIFHIQTDPLLLDNPVPKFLLQPLVENSFVHGFQRARPPWSIELSTEYLNETASWRIRIRDNGSGFNETAFKETQELISELNSGQIRQLDSLSNQGLGKMGIVNTLTRCRLFWNDEVSFTLNNLSQGMEFIIEIRSVIEGVSTNPC
ncbi:histidine kinase [Paenibacillus amylolyticus]|uniref:sensor histidine kinase n=1 Tax=Paenibacillus amylolyticus TaxID=1451 RepID=UPI003241C686